MRGVTLISKDAPAWFLGKLVHLLYLPYAAAQVSSLCNSNLPCATAQENTLAGTAANEGYLELLLA